MTDSEFSKWAFLSSLGLLFLAVVSAIVVDFLINKDEDYGD